MKSMKGRFFLPFLFLGLLILEPMTLLGNVPGDFEPDCDVDFNDFAILSSAWLTQNGEPNYNPKCDLSDPNDGVIDEKDLAVFIEFWLTKHPCDIAYIPAGTFQMGDSFNENDSDELPVHTVTLDFFYMCKYEVTNGHYCQYLNSALGQDLITVISGVVYKAGSGTSYPYCETSTSNSYSQIAYISGVFRVRTKGGRDMSDDPMVEVSWYGAAAYCNWRSQQEGKEPCYNLSTWECDFTKNGYRLPTEAQWEYAARGGLSGKRFPWGDTISHIQANYFSHWSEGYPVYPYDVNPTQGYHPIWSSDMISPYTSEVGSFPANGYELYDMAGDAWEWCNDWYGLYSSSPQTNPTGPTSGSSHVLRGGDWHSAAGICRVADRGYHAPSFTTRYVGFRLALSE